MKSMKAAGLPEVRSLRRRIRRLLAMDRVTKPDFEFIDERLDEVEARIVAMREINELGKEEE
jgi:hypothetical protein